MPTKRRVGRPAKQAHERRDVDKKFYIDDATNERFLRLFMESDAPSESAFLAELVRLGMEVKKRQLAEIRKILDSAA